MFDDVCSLFTVWESSAQVDGDGITFFLLKRLCHRRMLAELYDNFQPNGGTRYGSDLSWCDCLWVVPHPGHKVFAKEYVATGPAALR